MEKHLTIQLQSSRNMCLAGCFGQRRSTEFKFSRKSISRFTLCSVKIQQLFLSFSDGVGLGHSHCQPPPVHWMGIQESSLSVSLSVRPDICPSGAILQKLLLFKKIKMAANILLLLKVKFEVKGKNLTNCSISHWLSIFMSAGSKKSKIAKMANLCSTKHML